MSNKRKNYLINPQFQIRVTMYFVILAIINIIVFYGCVYYFFDIFYQKGLEVGLPKNHVFFMFIEDQITQMNSVFIIMSLLTTAILFIAGVLISHRIAGPMYRLDQDLQKMAEENKLEKVKFRKKDFFQEIPESFNKVVHSFKDNK